MPVANNRLFCQTGPSGETKLRKNAPSILAVVVLYKMRAEDSPAFCAMRSLLDKDPEARLRIEVMICDNSPTVQAQPDGFIGLYVADTANIGLARAYNVALGAAMDRGIPWLLLLDQDTTPTAEYVSEVLAQTAALFVETSIVAIVPKLLQNGVVQSPHGPPTYRHPKFDRSIGGLVPGPLYAFNSASVVRVPALQAIGGYPEEFWLDFLDHATFHLLQGQGGRIFVMQSVITHDLSANSIAKRDEAGKKRYQNILNAELKFYRKYGTTMDRVYLRMRLMRGCLGQLLRRHNPDEALQMLKAAARV